MMAARPGLAALSKGFQIAFQANTGDLWVAGTNGAGAPELGMAAGRGPAITLVPGSGVEVTYQADAGHLGSQGTTAPETAERP